MEENRGCEGCSSSSSTGPNPDLEFGKGLIMSASCLMLKQVCVGWGWGCAGVGGCLLGCCCVRVLVVWTCTHAIAISHICIKHTCMYPHSCACTRVHIRTHKHRHRHAHTHTRTHAHTQAPLRKGSTTWGEAQGRPGSERRCVCVSQCVCMCFARAYEFAKAVQWTLLFLETGVCAAHYYSKHKRLQAYVHTYTHTCTHFCKH